MSVLLDRSIVRNGARVAAGIGVATSLLLSAGPAAADVVRPRTVAATGGLCSIQLELANPSPGDQEVPRGLVISGVAFDRGAGPDDGTGMSEVQAFLGNRDEGGMLIGSTTFQHDSLASWTIVASVPSNVTGGQNLFIYGTSAISGEQAWVQVPIVIGESAPANIPVANTAMVSCPSIVQAPTPPVVAQSR